MRRRLIIFSFSSVLILVLGVLHGQVATQHHDASKLIGTWKLVSDKHNDVDLSKQVCLKHVTTTQSIWVCYDSKTKEVAQAAGGPYSVKGDLYLERPLYGLGPNFEITRDMQHTFNWRIEGDKWYHNGQLANGHRIEQVWQRVSEAEGE